MKPAWGFCLLLSVFCGGPLTATEPWTLVAFGDSTTAPRGELRTYAALLQQELLARHPDCRVINAGVGGHHTQDARARLEKDVLAHRPRIVIVQFGINDAAVDVWRDPPATAPRIPVAVYRRELREMLQILKARDAQVIFMTPNPMSWTPQLLELYGKPPYHPDDADGFNLLLKDYATQVRELAAAEQVPLVDVYQLFETWSVEQRQPVGNLLLDGMHPNDRGHRLIADALLRLLREQPAGS